MVIENYALQAGMDFPFASIVDTTTTAGYTYICEAPPGTLTSDANWRISRLNQSTGQTEWASGVGSFTQIADNRASLTYS